MPSRIPPPWIESKASKRRLYLLHLERLYTAGLKGCQSYGAASRGRRLSPQEIQAIEAERRMGPQPPEPINYELRKTLGARNPKF